MRSCACTKLPAYMVPSGYIPLAVFPLNTNGKIDRKALPRPEPEVQDVTQVRRPRDDREAQIAAIWSEVLGRPCIGIDQDFFALGGTSALAIEARARTERALCAELPLRAMFESPTVEAVAKRFGQGGQSDDPIVVSLQRGDASRAPLMCLHGVHLYQDLALALGGRTPVVGMHVPVRQMRGLGLGSRGAFAEVASRYVEIIRKHSKGPYQLAGLCLGGIVAYEAALQLQALGERVRLVAIFDGTQPRAVSYDQVARALHYLRKFVREPQAALQQAWDMARGFAPRPPWANRLSPLLERLRSPSATEANIPAAGSECFAEMARSEATVGYLDSHIIVFRATGRPQPAWKKVPSDLGWKGLGRCVSTYDVDSDHLEIIREPHVRVVARVLADELAGVDAEDGEGIAAPQIPRIASERIL